MWRSLFYAVGISLLILGGQSLMLDHVVTARKLRLPSVVKKLLVDEPASSTARNNGLGGQVANGVSASGIPNIATNKAPQGMQLGGNPIAGGVNTGSRFGPTRFSGPQYGHYGGPRTNGGSFQGNTNPVASSGISGGRFGGNYSQANYRPVAGAGQIEQTNRTAVSPDGKRLIKSKEWMPWCFLAVGTIVILYTNSWRPRAE